jgi:cell wall-associated NlpC family hydrolase
MIQEVSMKKLSILVTTLIVTIFITGTIYADTTYIIKKGDNPSNIAKKFKTNPQDILKANNINPKNMKPGTRITIPSGKDEPFLKNTSLRKQNTKTSRNVVKSNVKVIQPQEDPSAHIVKKGDTLLSLSKKYSIPVNEIRELNNLRSSKLKPGQTLTLRKTGPKSYTVKKGDNVYKIAKRFDLDIDELKEMNGLETDHLKPGQKILLEHETETNEPKTHNAILSQAFSRSDLEEDLMQASESEEHGTKDRLILFAKKLLDIPYRFGGNTLLGIDCSAYVQKVYSLIGINIPRSARQQFTEGNPVDKEELSIGDLVFFRTYASFPSHVGIYLGNNLFIHASSRSKKVTIDSLETPYYIKRFIGAKRLIDGEEKKDEPQKEG